MFGGIAHAAVHGVEYILGEILRQTIGDAIQRVWDLIAQRFDELYAIAQAFRTARPTASDECRG